MGNTVDLEKIGKYLDHVGAKFQKEDSPYIKTRISMLESFYQDATVSEMVAEVQSLARPAFDLRLRILTSKEERSKKDMLDAEYQEQEIKLYVLLKLLGKSKSIQQILQKIANSNGGAQETKKQ